MKERQLLYSDFAKFENFLISTFVLGPFTSLCLHWYLNWFQSNNFTSVQTLISFSKDK